MKASDLRIGNYLEEHGDYVKVGFRSFQYMKENEKLFFSYVKPIPLKEEWLERFGLRRFEGWDNMRFWFFEKDMNNHERFEILETKQGYELPSGKICEHVHTLQNAYYFHELTGEELTIKEQ